MKLLFDQNVSPDLVQRLGDLFPGSEHVYDADFSELSMLKGFPPKLLWLRIGNCTTSDIEELIRGNHSFILQLVDDDERGILSLFGRM